MQVLDLAAQLQYPAAGSLRREQHEVLAARVENERRTRESNKSQAQRAWSRRVRRVGGMIQAAFAIFWLLRGAVVIGGRTADVLVALSLLLGVGVFLYAANATAGKGARPQGEQARQIEKAVTTASVLEFLAALVLPFLVISSGHPDWVLPSIAITIGPLLLYLGHLLQIARYRVVGWALTVGPLVLVACLSGTVLVATTGLAAGLLLLATAVAGFRDLAAMKPGEGQ